MATELKRQLSQLKQGDHICLIYETPAEQLAAVVTFIVDGLTRGDRCVYIIDDPISILDVLTTDRLHELLSELPLFPYLDIRVTPLATHPSATPDPDWAEGK